MSESNEVFFKRLYELQESEPSVCISDSDRIEFEEIRRLRDIVAELESASDFTYYTST
jgi:hypothetical protein